MTQAKKPNTKRSAAKKPVNKAPTTPKEPVEKPEEVQEATPEVETPEAQAKVEEVATTESEPASEVEKPEAAEAEVVETKPTHPSIACLNNYLVVMGTDKAPSLKDITIQNYLLYNAICNISANIPGFEPESVLKEFIEIIYQNLEGCFNDYYRMRFIEETTQLSPAKRQGFNLIVNLLCGIADPNTRERFAVTEWTLLESLFDQNPVIEMIRQFCNGSSKVVSDNDVIN